ncbi:hypothetical protein [Leptothermofonsia sp. ETS-13]|uniref:hypothetical protein n=1 Tax=Leptothermofonsia sp. ETS-13 TaxID=3035696 RepID=UPI003BA1EB20
MASFEAVCVLKPAPANSLDSSIHYTYSLFPYPFHVKDPQPLSEVGDLSQGKT